MRSPILSSRSAAATSRTIPPGTRSTAIRPTRPRRSCSAKKAPARRPCGCRWPAASRCYNAQPQNSRLFVIEYDDFNPFLDHFADRLSARKQRDPAKVLAEWKLWDHMDAILSLGVTSLVDRLLGVPQPTGPDANQMSADRLRSLDRHQKRDLLAARRVLRQLDPRKRRRRAGAGCAANCAITRGRAWWDRVLGVAVTAAVVGDDRLLAAMGLARNALAVRDRRARLAAVARAAVRNGTWSPGESPAMSACSSRTSARSAGC